MKTSSEPDLIKEAEALLTHVAPNGNIRDGASAYLFDMRGPELLRRLVEEVKTLRDGAVSLRERERKQLSTVIEIRGCDKCDLCEDHQ